MMIIDIENLQVVYFWCLLFAAIAQSARVSKRQANDVVAEMEVLCLSDAIMLKVNTDAPFNGMVYSKESLNSSSRCFSEYNLATQMTYRIPLNSCGTLSNEVDDGIEYFNTIVIQPHTRLMTNQGKTYHIRCKYQTRERTVANAHFNVSATFSSPRSLAEPTPLLATASMPSCTMKIYRSGRSDVAESVKIGDKLIMLIEIDQQDMYGMRITNCLVRDGLNLAEQLLISANGCAVDENIMPKFEYSNNFTRAAVAFPAHKFPHTSSVFYQCNVRLCINTNGSCNQQQSVHCKTKATARRRRLAKWDDDDYDTHDTRSTTNATIVRHNSSLADANPSDSSNEPINSWGFSANSSSDQEQTMSFDVFSGLQVTDENDSDNNNQDQTTTTNDVGTESMPPSKKSRSESPGEETTGESTMGKICVSLSRASAFIIYISLASIGVVLVLLCQVGMFDCDQYSFQRRRSRMFPSHYTSD